MHRYTAHAHIPRHSPQLYDQTHSASRYISPGLAFAVDVSPELISRVHDTATQLIGRKTISCAHATSLLLKNSEITHNDGRPIAPHTVPSLLARRIWTRGLAYEDHDLHEQPVVLESTQASFHMRGALANIALGIKPVLPA